MWGMKRPKFVTLTLRRYAEVPNLADTQRDLHGRRAAAPGSGSREKRTAARLRSLWGLRKCLFRRLRRAGYMIGPWFAVIEPPNHIHLVIDSDYIPKSLISSWWNEITGDSFVVDIKKIDIERDPRQAVAYVTKYLSKASAWDGINLDLIAGFHVAGSWGLSDQKREGRPICPCGFRDLRRINADDFFVLVDMVEGLGPWKQEMFYTIDDGCE
jgi:hypothetical protein